MKFCCSLRIWPALLTVLVACSAEGVRSPTPPPACSTSASGCTPPQVPADKPAEVPGDKPAQQPTDKPAEVPADKPADPGTEVQLALPAASQAQLSKLEAELAPLSAATADSLLRDHGPTFETSLGYDPKTAQHLDLIQATPLALDDAELAKLGEQGFAISTRQKFPNMAYGLKSIYAYDLPVYISIDPILDAVHDAYDNILAAIETQVLFGDLTTLLEVARSRNKQHTADAQTRQDLDLYFSVALSLLKGAPVPAAAGANPALIETLVTKATDGVGIQPVQLFGVKRELDFSQFTPRGHYTDTPELSRYFRAMIWLGRTDFRLIETQSNGGRVFHRRQLNAVLALREAVQGPAADAWKRIDGVVTAFVGPHDYMQLGEVDALLEDLRAISTDIGSLSDAAVAQAILDGGYGAQRILSQVIFKDPSTHHVTLPLDRSFALLGQRYVVDSHVFSDVTYDRVLPTEGRPMRFLPDPLDAAYAALGNAAALPILKDGLDRYGYAPHLERARTLVDGFDRGFWDENLYNIWLSSLRAMSQPSAADDMPAITRTEPWSRRVLHTQLASWAQLRHDTILYAKQSYSSAPSCEFPDAYVDPYPAAFERLAFFATRGKAIGQLLGAGQSMDLVNRVTAYFSELESVANILRDMAEQQLEGVPFNAAQMAFVNDAVRSSTQGCGGPMTYEGWYARLMFNRSDAEMIPVIADVHTDPGGDHPPQVLHVAAGLPRLMVVTVDTCMGPRAYAGVSYAYHEVVTENLQRLTDEKWATMARDADFVPWMKEILQ